MASKTTNGDRVISISVVSNITGIEVYTLRYWETEFSHYLNPPRTPGGQRRYRPSDIQKVLVLKRLLREQMFSIAGARKYLAERGEAA